MLSKSKKRVFITGASSGIGLGLVKKFSENGDTVCACSLEPLEEVKRLLPANVHYFQADVTDRARMREVVSEFTIISGGLDIVVANAGINHEKAKIPDFVWGLKVIDVNVKGVLNTLAPAIEIMKEQGRGQLVCMSSISGVIGGLPGMSIYGASKAAVYSLGQSLAIDLREFGISVTTLAPGFIDTPLTRNNRHSMPFKMSSEAAVEKIFMAIKRKKDLYLFPYPLRIITRALAWTPRFLRRGLMRANWLKLGKS